MKKIYFLLASALFLLLSTNISAQSNNIDCDGLTVSVYLGNDIFDQFTACRQVPNKITVEWILEDMTIIQKQVWNSIPGTILTFTIPYFCEEDIVGMKISVHEGAVPGNGCCVTQEFAGYVLKVKFGN